MKMSAEYVEAIKEFIRTLVGGMIFVLIGVLTFIKSGINVEFGGFNIDWMVAWAMLISGFIGVVQTALASGFDKWLHERKIQTPLDLKSLDVLKK